MWDWKRGVGSLRRYGGESLKERMECGGGLKWRVGAPPRLSMSYVYASWLPRMMGVTAERPERLVERLTALER